MKKWMYFLFLGAWLSGCEIESQMEKDDEDLQNYIKKNNLAVEKHATGFYYKIFEPGTGTGITTEAANITVKYKGSLLNGEVFDNGGGVAQTFKLNQLILAWQIGIPLVKAGGKILILTPSTLAYGPGRVGNIPPNSPLVFEVELIEVMN